ncbi:alpha/beta-hydrolase [Rhizophagus irregularis]|uniref:Alpha/beta-hydrolase n=1 Tax=Rhizophagus irregularis TaxID=588596 RepID=A0A2I1GG84_9GLOM|nr:alpha/beta-hydrolase [Rhizophagus irregularis]
MPPDPFENELNLANAPVPPSVNSVPPVVFVEGFMGSGKQKNWGPLAEIFKNTGIDQNCSRKLIFVKPGCCNSLHDRAIEIFYQIKGGRVDYGEEHAKEFGHARFGRRYKGFYPQWSASNPVHFLAHSLGGITIWKLQQLLASDIFPASLNPHPDMILSLTAVSTPFKGTQGVYLLGSTINPNNIIRPFSIGCWLGRFVHIYEYFNIQWLKELFYDFNVDHWNFYWKNVWVTEKEQQSDNDNQNTFEEIKQSVAGKTYGLLYCLYKSPWLYNKDNGPFDMTIHGMKIVNETSRIFPNTFYRSYVTTITCTENSIYHTPKPSLSLYYPIYYLSYKIGRFRFPEAYKQYQPITDEELPEWYENDGLCPIISQYHPFSCSPGYCTHHDGMPPSEKYKYQHSYQVSTKSRPNPVRGQWEVWKIEDTTHWSIIPVWYNDPKQMEFFVGYKEYLDQLDALHL